MTDYHDSDTLYRTRRSLVLWVSRRATREALIGGTLTEVEWKGGVVVRLAVGDEVDLVLALLLLQPVLGAPVVTHAAAAQDEDDDPHQPEPCRRQRHSRKTVKHRHMLIRVIHVSMV
jgi:hypothetical protein